MERLYVAALIKNDVLLPQCGQYLLFIDADVCRMQAQASF